MCKRYIKLSNDFADMIFWIHFGGLLKVETKILFPGQRDITCLFLSSNNQWSNNFKTVVKFSFQATKSLAIAARYKVLVVRRIVPKFSDWLQLKKFYLETGFIFWDVLNLV